MSRVGEKPIFIPDGVRIELKENTITVEGSKGRLVRKFPPGVKAEIKEKEITIKRLSMGKKAKSVHGLSRSLLANMVQGVSEGFQKSLEIIGVGYKANLKDNKLILSLGFSHPIEFPIPIGMEIKVEKGTKLTISGCDKELVGEIASRIRSLRPPEAYKGKGIRYCGEYIKRKVGKSAVVGPSGT